jgi:ubiquitin-protein ligase
MDFPLPNEPLVPDFAHTYLIDTPRYDENARERTEKYAQALTQMKRN